MPKEFINRFFALKNKSKYLLFIVVFIGFILRFWQLGENPKSINWDEAAWGYNAYSMGIDGREEFGNLLPYKFIESFGDFKPPVYAYLGIIPVKLFGLNEFSTRFPSALFGVLSVLLTYLLVKQIFSKSENSEKFALFSALFLAISPWHILLSRAAFEANVSSFFIILGIYLFIKALNKNIWLLVFSAASFAVSFYTFNTARVFIPLFIIFITIILRKEIFKNLKPFLVSGIVGLIILLPIIPFLVSPQAKLRFQEVNIFTNPEIVKSANQSIQNDNGLVWSKIINNRRVLYAREFASHYFDNLSPSFLFIKGDGNPKFSTQDMGQLYIWELFFLVPGIFLLFRRREGYYWIIPIWLLLGIIPAATARETPHALRIETTLPVFQILTAIGVIYFLNSIRNLKKQKYIASGVFLLLFVNFLYFFHSYFVHYPRESAADWNYGYKQAYSYLRDVESDYDNIYFTSVLGRPHIYYLYYDQVDPNFYRENSDITRDVFGFVHVNRIGKYYFNNIPLGESKGKNIHIERWDKVPENAKILKEFKLPDGNDMLIAYVES